MKVQLELTSDEKVLEFVDNVTQHFLQLLDWSEDDAHWFSIAIREVAINAIVHGNKKNMDKKVFLWLEHHEGEVCVRVRDQGEGDKVPAIPDAAAPENLLKPHGRGLFIANQLVDELTLTRPPEGGLTVTMKKTYNQGGDHENSCRRTG